MSTDGWARVQDGGVVATRLPRVAPLADGSIVSGYSHLPPDTLAAEGWLPLTDQRPDYDAATQQLVLDHYEIGDAEVTAVYVAQPIPDPPPAPPTAEQFAALQSAVATLTMQVLTGGA